MNPFTRFQPAHSEDDKPEGPGLRLEDIDRIAREHYAMGHEKARLAAFEHISRAGSQGHENGLQDGWTKAMDWMWPNAMFPVHEVAQQLHDLASGEGVLSDEDFAAECKARLKGLADRLDRASGAYQKRKAADGGR